MSYNYKYNKTSSETGTPYTVIIPKFDERKVFTPPKDIQAGNSRLKFKSRDMKVNDDIILERSADVRDIYELREKNRLPRTLIRTKREVFRPLDNYEVTEQNARKTPKSVSFAINHINTTPEPYYHKAWYKDYDYPDTNSSYSDTDSSYSGKYGTKNHIQRTIKPAYCYNTYNEKNTSYKKNRALPKYFY